MIAYLTNTDVYTETNGGYFFASWFVVFPIIVLAIIWDVLKLYINCGLDQLQKMGRFWYTQYVHNIYKYDCMPLLPN